MFGDPVENPMGWESSSLGKLNVILEGGKNIAEDADALAPKNKILKISAVSDGNFRPTETKALPDDYDVPANYYVKKFDLLMSRANTEELVGATAYVWETQNNLVLPDKIWRFVFPKEVSLDKIFFWKLAQTRYFRSEVSKRATGTSGSMKNISKPKTLSITFMLPPIDLQNKFAAIIEKIESQKALYQEELEKLQENFDALLARSFEG